VTVSRLITPVVVSYRKLSDTNYVKMHIVIWILQEGPNLGDLHFNETWSATFPGQCECISHGTLYTTLDVSTGVVYTTSYGFITKAVFVLTVLNNTGLPTERYL
jgi:hypothetical protein